MNPMVQATRPAIKAEAMSTCDTEPAVDSTSRMNAGRGKLSAHFNFTRCQRGTFIRTSISMSIRIGRHSSEITPLSHHDERAKMASILFVAMALVPQSRTPHRRLSVDSIATIAASPMEATAAVKQPESVVQLLTTPPELMP